jgi:predicted Zn-dependent protease
MKWMAAVVLGSLAFAQEPSSNGVNFYSLAKEQELGRSFAAKLQSALPVVHETALDAYVAKLGSALARHVDSSFTYSFTLYEDRSPAVEPARPDFPLPSAGLATPADAFQGPAGEPVAVAGGAIFVPMSLLANAPNETVFAFQLAHAMAHIALRHQTRLATKAELMQISTQVAQEQNGRVSDRHTDAMPIGTLAFARASEREADYVAVQLVSQAGYNPEAMAAYLDGLPAVKESRAMSVHSTLSERAAAIRGQFEKLPPASYVASTGNFAEAKALAAAVR